MTEDTGRVGRGRTPKCQNDAQKADSTDGAAESRIPPKRKRRQNPETKIRKSVKEYLLLNGWFVFPNTQGLGCHRGISDLTAMRYGRVIWVEIKTPRGKQNYEQWEFEQNVVKHGCEYRIARSVDDVLDLSREARE